MSMRVCVYRGLGADNISLSMLYRCLTRYCDPTKYSVNYITPEQICTGQLVGASLLAIGGGYDLGFIQALGPAGIDHIKQYVYNGGRYLGICAGAYFASGYVEFDRDGPLSVCGKRDLCFFPGKCIGPVLPGFVYNQFNGAWPTQIEITSSPILNEPYTCGKESQLYCFFNGGGYFQGEGTHMKNCITAKYLDKRADGLAAIVRCPVGQGKALLSGVHFEYDPEYLDQENSILKDRVLPRLWQTERLRKTHVRQLLRYLDIHDAPSKL